MTKPLIIAICGKSAAGKDTLMKMLYKTFQEKNTLAHIMISDTTRPKRINEQENVDYYFISNREFQRNIWNNQYLEYAEFRKWYYGTHRLEVDRSVINIGVFNPKGITNLAELQNEFTVLPVYLKVNFRERMLRSYNREEKFKFEYLRRAFVDWKDFYNIEFFLSACFKNYLIFKNPKQLDQVCLSIYYMIKQRGLDLRLGKNL